MDQSNWDIREEGRSWRNDEVWQRFELLPRKFEMIDGQLLLSDEERENLLGVLLELVGAGRVVQLGSPDVWRAATASLPD